MKETRSNPGWWLLAWVGLTTGCQPSTLPGTSTPDTEKPYPHIAVDAALGGQLITDSALITGGTGDKPLAVIVPIRATASGGLKIEYRFEFLDSAGRTTEQTPPWRRQFLADRVQLQLSDTAFALKSVDWRLQIRPANW